MKLVRKITNFAFFFLWARGLKNFKLVNDEDHLSVQRSQVVQRITKSQSPSGTGNTKCNTIKPSGTVLLFRL